MVAESTTAPRDPAPLEARVVLETIELEPEDNVPSHHAKSASNESKISSKDLENGTSLNAEEVSTAPRHAASDERTFINAIIAFLGSGILGLPFAFRKTGILVRSCAHIPSFPCDTHSCE